MVNQKKIMHERSLKSGYLHLALFLLSVIALHTPPAWSQGSPVADPDPARFQKGIDAFVDQDRNNSHPENAILFVGSSSIRLWATRKVFGDYPVINRGFGGSHISDVNHYFDLVVKKHAPDVIVFYAGDNDIAAGKPPSQVFDDYVEFAGRVKAELASSCVIYLPIKPSINRWQMWPAMQEANAMIETFSRSNDRFYYVDIAGPMFSDDGRPRPELFIGDGLHLNERGYELWESILAPHLEAVYPTCMSR